MRFLRPTTLDDAVAALAGDPDARCLAGGQTLVAMMNAELLHPSTLVSLRGIAALGGIVIEPGGAITIGAMATHAEIAAFSGFRDAQGLLAAAVQQIAHVPIRNAGTIGGSIAHADPMADFPAALVAVDAAIDVAGPRGRRQIPAAAFFVDYLQSALVPGEIVAAVRVPAAPAGTRHRYEKLARVHGDFAIVTVAVVLARAADGRCTYARLVAGSCGATPVRSTAAEARLVGSTLAEEDVVAAVKLLVAASNPLDDFRGSAAYRRKILSRLAERAIAAIREESP